MADSTGTADGLALGIRQSPAAARLAPVPRAEWDSAAFVAAWDALASRAAEPNPFMESWFLGPALRLLEPGGQVTLLGLFTDEGLAGLLPVARPWRYYRWPLPHLAGWSHPNAFLGTPLVAAGQERTFWRALLAWCDRAAGPALFLHLNDLPLEGPLAAALLAEAAAQGRGAGLVHRAARAFLESDLTPDAYLAASMTGKKRKELRRQAARLGECGATGFERTSGDEGLEAWIADFLALEAGGWKGQAGSALALHPQTASLFAETLRGAAARGRLERLSLVLDGRPIAMLANFVTPPGLFSFKTAYDEGFARFSPGVLLQCENLKLLDRPEILWADSCAAADHPMIDRIWRERRQVGRISVAIGGRLRRALFDRLLSAELARNPTGVGT